MKSILIGLLAGLAIFGIHRPCHGEDPLIFGTYPIPLMVVDPDRGLFIELTKTIAARLGMTIKIDISPTPKAIQRFRDKTMDVLFPAFDVYFSSIHSWLKSTEPFYTKKDFIFTRNGEPLLNDIKSLIGKRVGITSGYPYADELLKNKNIHFEGAIDDETNLRKLIRKELMRSSENLAAAEPTSFDVVTCMEMLEHVPDPASIVRACGQLVRPGGWVFFSTLNRNPKSYLFAIIGAEYLLSLLPRGTHDYARFIRPSELGGWIRAAGLVLRDLTGISNNLLTGIYSLSDDLDVNYLVATERQD